jgi:LysR family nitrogen assimilation transcriptional regulator
MDLRQFKYFLRIAELGSVSRAAESLHVAQSALSRHVANMEAEFGQALLLRTGRGVALTPAGEELARYARAMLRLGDEAKAALAQTADSPTGTLSVGFPLSLTRALCIPLIERARSLYPRLALQLHDEISGALADRLRSGRLQVALLFEGVGLDGLSWQPVFEEELFLAVSARHPLARESKIDLEWLATVPLAIPSAPFGVRPIVEQALRKAGLAPQVLVEANSLTVMAHVARAGLGGAVLSACSVADEVAAGDLVLLPLAGAHLVRRIVVAISPVEPQLTATGLVFDLMVTLAREQADQGRWRGCKPLAH